MFLLIYIRMKKSYGYFFVNLLEKICKFPSVFDFLHRACYIMKVCLLGIYYLIRGDHNGDKACNSR